MTVSVFAQLVVNGLSIGLIYVLIASGLILILGIARIFNFAHGNFYMLGAYVVYSAYFLFHLNFFASLILAALIVGLFGGICYQLVFCRVQGNILLGAMASIGLMLMMEQGILLGFGTKERGMSTVFTRMITVGGIRLPEARLMVILLCFLVMAGLYILLMKTKVGKAMRAVSSNADAASLLGIDTHRIFIITMIVGCVLAGLAGAIIAPVFAIHSGMGHSVLFLVFMVLILGGMNSIPGAVLGGMMTGLLVSFGFHFFGGFVYVFLFCFIAVFMVLKPGGLLGQVITRME